MKLSIWIWAALIALLTACSGTNTDPGTGGGGTGAGTAAAGSGGAGGSSGSTSSGDTTSSAGGSGGACEVPGPAPCGPEIPGLYPDPSLSYAPDAAMFGALGPIPPNEIPEGAAAARLGPFATDLDVSELIVIASTLPGFCELPDPVRVSAWVEDQCGLPATKPNVNAFDTALASVVQEPIDGTSAVRLRIPMPWIMTVPAGSSVYVAFVMTGQKVCAQSFEPTGDEGPRAMWFGKTDADCDGATDPDLGWTYLAHPTDPSVGEYPYDLGFGVMSP